VSRHAAVPITTGRTRSRIVGGVVRVVTVLGLIVDALIHLQLAPGYELAAPGGIGQGNLFRGDLTSA
jgi:hypothetical protein